MLRKNDFSGDGLPGNKQRQAGFEMLGVGIYTIVTELLVIAGIWKILMKCGEKGWYAIIPGLRYYKLGACNGKERDGLRCLFLEIIVRIMSFFDTEGDIRTPTELVISQLVLVGAILLFIFEIRVIFGVLRTFNMKKKWAFLWELVPWIVTPIIGFSSRFQPVNLGQFKEEGLKGGLTPANLSAPAAHGPSAEGLTVNIKERKVRDFTRKRYLLKDIHLFIPNGSLVLLLGGSGAGKTTLVSAINGYEKANAEILLNGVNVYENYGQMKYRIGFVPQQDLLRMNDTVRKTLSDSALLRLSVQTKEQERNEKIHSVMEILGLTEGADGLISKKSGGQKKRISIGTELISDPDLFILDEPDSGLDGVIARELFEKLRMVADEGKIVIAITHTPDRVIELFDKVIVLAKDSGKVGRLAFYGSPKQARTFFGKKTMEEIVMAVNSEEEGGEGRADEFIEKYAKMTTTKGAADHE